MMADYVENLKSRLSEVEAERDRFRDALSRMSLVDDDMGIYMAGSHNPDGTFTPRDGFGDGWNAAVGQYGSALLAELYEMQDEGIVPDLADAATGDGDNYGVLVAFLRRAKRADAELSTLRAEQTRLEQRLSEVEVERDQALVGEAYANGMGLAAVEAWESRALKAEVEQTRLREASESVLAAWPLDGTGNLSLVGAIRQLRAALSSTPTPETTP